MLVPFAIKEAENLYGRHMYVSLALWQMWRTREDYIHSESGLEHLSGTDDVTEALNKMKLSVGGYLLRIALYLTAVTIRMRATLRLRLMSCLIWLF
jgi:hypothetical protein